MTNENSDLAMIYGLWGMNGGDGGWKYPPRKPSRRALRKARKAQAKAAKAALHGGYGHMDETQINGTAQSPIPDEAHGGFLLLWQAQDQRPEAQWFPSRRQALLACWALGRAKGAGGIVKIQPYSESLRDAVLSAQADLATGLE